MIIVKRKEEEPLITECDVCGGNRILHNNESEVKKEIKKNYCLHALVDVVIGSIEQECNSFVLTISKQLIRAGIRTITDVRNVKLKAKLNRPIITELITSVSLDKQK